jgi:hypothetical protein
MALQAEFTIDFAKYFQLGFGFVNPGSMMGSARGYFYRNIFEVGMVGQFAMFDRLSTLETEKGLAVGGGLTTGVAFELPVGEIGARLEFTTMVDVQKGGTALPINTGIFWRMR